MENFFYAQITEDNICYAVTQSAGNIDQYNMIPINDYDISLLGMKWDSESKEWKNIDNLNGV